MTDRSDDDYRDGYAVGFTNGQYSAPYAIAHGHPVPTAEQRAQCINFHGNAARREGWLAGWTKAIEPYRAHVAEPTPAVRYVVRTFDNTYWHSNGVSGETLFRDRVDAEHYLTAVTATQRPGQSALIIVERVIGLVQSVRGGRVHLPANDSDAVRPRCRRNGSVNYRMVRDLNTVVTCIACQRTETNS